MASESTVNAAGVKETVFLIFPSSQNRRYAFNLSNFLEEEGIETMGFNQGVYILIAYCRRITPLLRHPSEDRVIIMDTAQCLNPLNGKHLNVMSTWG